MPELPEAETIARELHDRLVGEVVRRVEVLRADVVEGSGRQLSACLRGSTIEGIGRRAKKVVMHMGPSRTLVVSLGMTGRLLPFDTPPRGRRRPRHPAVRLRFESGRLLVFDDTRRFGKVSCLSRVEWEERSRRIGPEPLSDDFTARDLHTALSKSRAPIRSWLLDQKRIAGVGNIYAAESLYLAGIHPQRRSESVEPPEAIRLWKGLRGVLQAAIDAGGTTIRDYRNAAGEEGAYSTDLSVYGRDGEPCGRCGATIVRTVFGNRSAFFCPRCQPWSE